MRVLRFVFFSFVGLAIAVAIVFGLIALGRFIFSDPVATDCPVCEPQTAPQVSEEYIAPATRVESGAKVGYGTLTFDSETRVWILSKFVVPSTACYAFDYSGREKGVQNAPFYVGSELNPVDGKPFTICYDTTSVACKPPVEVTFYQ